MPNPFARTQLVDGTNEADVLKLVNALFERFREGLSPNEILQFGRQQDKAVFEFMERSSVILKRLPHAVTEAAIQEWLVRLDDLWSRSRFSEASVMETWLDVAFGREVDDKQRPLDVRIHRRLGDLYAAGGQAENAGRQFELGRRPTPRDIFLLRKLGKAYLDQNNSARAGEIIAEIEGFDKEAFRRNSENAALKARWCEQRDDLVGARDVLATAYTYNPSSYYLGDLLGQALVSANEIEKAREIYTQVRRTLSRLREQNVWTCATALSAAIVCGDETEVKQTLAKLSALHPTRGDLDTIERGALKLLTALGRGTSVINEVRSMADQT
ncbi:MAG: hypothetical protein JO110_15760 [Acetobacteraceae bacterium]|nr:hypothetical protein [Acetobacteraceae bacterium]